MSMSTCQPQIFFAPEDFSSSVGLVTVDPHLPKGWSDDLSDMLYDYFWLGDEGDLKAQLETSYGLADALPICINLHSPGDIVYLFESGSEYYVWSGGSAHRIKGLRRLQDIYAAISKHDGGIGCLEMEDVKRIME